MLMPRTDMHLTPPSPQVQRAVLGRGIVPQEHRPMHWSASNDSALAATRWRVGSVRVVF
jgi:hypothetical protein